MFGKSKKGMLFTIDALFAVIIIVTALFFISKNYVIDDKNNDMSYVSYDLVKSFSSIKTGELNNSYLKTLIANGIVNNTNNTLLETIGELYVLNKTYEAEMLTKNISSDLIPSQYGFAIAVNDEIVYSNEKNVTKGLVGAKRLISGIEKFKPIRGSTSKVYLEGLEEKKDSAYIFFGGFIGQGNISDFTDDIPLDANITKIVLQAEIGSNINDSFTVFINGNNCSSNITKKSSEMKADIFDITTCKNNLVLGSRNNFTIIPNPSSKFDIAYISGGFVRFDYFTKQMYKSKKEGYVKYYFPTIDGLINIYSSVYIPGNISNMNIQLKYFVNHTNTSNSTFYMKIGNTTVIYDSNSTTIQTISLDGSVLESMGLNYSFLSDKNIPIRVGAENVSYLVEYSGTADAILVTDVSGSMADQMGSNNGGTNRNCSDPNFNLSTTSRISIAKCLDKEFSNNMLNVSGNLIGLVSYTTTTNSTLNLTSNITKINNSINNYTSLSSTCICCGINSASNILSTTLKRIVYVSNNTLWNFTNNSFSGAPLNDSNNKAWYARVYLNESSWSSGNASLGHLSGTPTLKTDMGGGMIFINYSHPFMWENSSDNNTPEADFTNGWNSTGSFFGNSTKNNGWDYSNGTSPYGYDNKVNFSGPKKGVISLSFATGNPLQNRCTNNDCSGAYGIEINITPELFSIINGSNGKVYVEFNYAWESNPSNPFESSDEVWIKSRWTSPTSGVHYLGSELSNDDSDSNVEVASGNNPDNEFNGLFSFNIKPYVESSGNYYLDFGAKLFANANDEWGNASFDNVSIKISNSTETYYLRKHFYVNDTTISKKYFMNLMSDKSAKVYLNGNLIFSDNTINNATYWNNNGIKIENNLIYSGDNVFAVELFTNDDFSRFDLELFGINDSRNKAMLVMTDGQANVECSEQGTTLDLDHDGSADTSLDDAIQASCDARKTWGITVYAVGFSTEADETTLNYIASCGKGTYLRSNDTALLLNFYNDVAEEIMDVARVEQKIVVMGSPTLSKLFGSESFIEINYSAPVKPAQIGDISINFEEKINSNCTFNVNISPKIRVIDSKVTSYSSSKWTDFLFINNKTIYNLSIFNEEYEFLGDPFIVGFSPTLLNPGNIDNLSIRTGIDSSNSTGCSLNSSLLYTGLMKATITYSDVLEFADGCAWTIEFEDNSTQVINVPKDYSGGKSCTFRSSGVSYNVNDTYDDAVFKLLDSIDLDGDRKADVNLVDNNLVIGAISVNKVPYPWGPAIAEVRVWQ